jgi:O-antigen/teichoic acid export membrane protein
MHKAFRNALDSISRIFGRAYAAILKNSSLKNGVMWSMIGALIGRSLGLISSIVVARVLHQIEFGRLSMIQSTVATFVVVGTLGMGLTATKYVAQFKKSEPGKAGRVIALSVSTSIIAGTVLMFGVFFSAPSLSELVLGSENFADLVKISATLLFFNSINNAQAGVLLGFEAFKTIARTSLIAGLVSVPMTVLGATLGGLDGVLFGLACSSLVNCALSNFEIRRLCSANAITIDYKRCHTERQMLLRFSLPSLLSGLVVAPATWACNAILARQAAGFADLAAINIGYQWRTVILFVPAAVSNILLPMLAAMSKNGSTLESDKLIKKNVALTLLIAALTASVVIAASPMIMRAYGEDYRNSWEILALIALSSVPMATANAISQAITSSGNMWVLFTMDALWALCIVASTIMFVPLCGGSGLALAYVIAYMCHCTWQWMYLKSNQTVLAEKPCPGH